MPGYIKGRKFAAIPNRLSAKGKALDSIEEIAQITRHSKYRGNFKSS
jgi:hypothetical protein